MKVPVARKMNSKARTTVIRTKHPAPVRKVEKFQKSGKAPQKGKPRATTSVKKSSKKRKASKNILSEEEIEELCERLESKRHDLDCEILYFPIPNNALCLPPKFCINYFCGMLLGICRPPKSISQQ